MSGGLNAPHAALFDVAPPETRSMVTRDGVRLDADIYRPIGAGPCPVLLQRQAYGRRIACTICYAHPAWYAARGYLVVVQDVRGRGTSDGDFKPGEHEASDGAEAIAWAAALPGSTGAVGLYGFSYQSYNQLLAAVEAGPALKALAPAMGPWDARTTWAFESGAFRLRGSLAWAIQIGAETARRAGHAEAFAAFAAVAQTLPVDGPVAARPALLDRYRALSHYHRWLETPADDDYWAAISPARHVDAIAARDLPMLLIGGWYDTHLGSVLETHEALTERGATKLKLVIGPWQHFPWTRRVGDVDFGPQAARSMDDLHIRWFDHWLKGRDTGLMDEPAVDLFDMGQKTWRGWAAWPRRSRLLILQSTGRASIDDTDGKLGRGASRPCREPLVHDPWRPSPAVGGAYGSPSGPADRRAVDSRGDVLTFTTAPFEQPETLVGTVEAHLDVASDRPSFDIACVLSLVSAAGRVTPLCDGYAGRCTDGRVRVPMRASCLTVSPGDALRLSIAPAAFPAFAVNPGTGADPTSSARADAVVTTLWVSTGAADASWLDLPIAPEAGVDPA